MRSFLRRRFVLACVLGLAVVGLGQSAALAAPTPSGPVQPGTAPFAGVTYTATGDIGQGTGLTWTFSGLSGQVTQYQSLEWGPTDATAVDLAMNGDSTFSTAGQMLTFNAGASDLANGRAVWTGSTPYPLADPPGTVISLLTRLTLTATDGTSSPITGFKATGQSYGGGATVPVTGNFSANMLFEVSTDNGATWTPATDYFNDHSCCNVPPPPLGEQSSFGAGFFYVLNSHLSLTPNPLDFGTVQVGQSSTNALTLTNTGTAPTHVTNVTLGGANPGDFSLDASSLTCTRDGSGAVVPAGGSCAVNIVFTPGAASARSATLTVQNDSLDGPQQVTLTGTGAKADLAISIGASPNPIKHGKNAFLTYTVTLQDAGPSQAAGIVISDPLPSFTQFESLTLPAGVTCTAPAVGASGTLTCNLSTINPGQSVRFRMVVLVVASKAMNITNTVTVTSQTVDPSPANNQASASTVVK